MAPLRDYWQLVQSGQTSILQSTICRHRLLGQLRQVGCQWALPVKVVKMNRHVGETFPLVIAVRTLAYLDRPTMLEAGGRL